LLLLGDLTEEEKGGVLPAQYQGALVAAVKRFHETQVRLATVKKDRAA